MPNVDYGSDDVAHRYAHTRGLPDAVLAGWGAAVNTFVPPHPEGDRVLDVGAGTGIFARAWPTWRPCQVVALEPSSAMRTQLVGAGLPDGVHVIVGRGEQVPIRALGITIAWLSAVVDVDFHGTAAFQWPRSGCVGKAGPAEGPHRGSTLPAKAKSVSVLDVTGSFGSRLSNTWSPASNSSSVNRPSIESASRMWRTQLAASPVVAGPWSGTSTRPIGAKPAYCRARSIPVTDG